MNIIQKFNQIDKIRLNSFLVAYILSFNAFAGVLNYLVPGFNGIGAIVASVSIILYLISFDKSNIKKVKENLSFLSLVIFAFFVLSVLRFQYSYTIQTLFYFLYFGFFVMIIGVKSYNVRKVLNDVAWMSTVLGIPLILAIDSNLTSGLALTMGFSYAILPISIVSVAHFFLFRTTSLKKVITELKKICLNKSNRSEEIKNMKSLVKSTIKNINNLQFVGYIASFYLIFRIMIDGTRGASLSILVLIWIAGLICLDRIKNEKRKKHCKIAYIILPILVFLLVMLFFNDFVSFLTDISNKYDLYFIRKTVKLFEYGDLTNGRSDIYEAAWGCFKNSPIIGNGIGTFKYFTGQHSFPHNLILQLLFEGGILFFIPFAYLIIKGIYIYIFKSEKKLEERMYYAVLFAVSVVPLMLSNELWRVQIFWILIAFTLKEINLEKDFRKIIDWIFYKVKGTAKA